jgi:hypothetical protein
MRVGVLVRLLALLTLAAPPDGRAEPTQQDLVAQAAFIDRLGALNAGFSRIEQEASALDALADRAFGGRVSAEEARAQADALVADLRARHAALAAELATALTPPAVSDADIRKANEGAAATMRAVSTDTLEAIEIGAALVEAAIRRDADFYRQSSLKALERKRTQLGNHSAALELQISAVPEETLDYGLVRELKNEIDAARLIIRLQIAAIEGRTPGSDDIAATTFLLDAGRGHLRRARAAYERDARDVAEQTAPGAPHAANKKTLEEMLAINEALLDIGVEMLDALEGHLRNFAGGRPDRAAFDAFILRTNALRDRRQALYLDRQRKLAELVTP